METKQVLDDVGMQIVEAMRAQLRANGNKFEGNLINKMRSFTKDNSLNVTMPLYGKFVDEGTRTHMPPVNSIAPWAKSKGLNPWAVAINIKKNGTKSHPFIFKFSEVVHDNKQLIQTTIGKEIGDNLGNLLKQNYKY